MLNNKDSNVINNLVCSFLSKLKIIINNEFKDILHQREKKNQS